ncbi:hypothetical protein R6Q59_026476 [Mikania micrantha]|uniref:Uncharacterized protein n=1 Tax=Mikania micrantha TaxID=192012 RepID=A0A5N6Q2P5_9ASTR|nr:hypothetical protein E3N88_01066 [Mikania micrantha]
MEGTASRELIKSVIIMAGIPLVFSVACSIYAKITERKISSLQDRIQETKTENMSSDDEDNSRNVNQLKEQMFTLRCKIEELQGLENEIELRFLRFIELKDQEHALMEVQNSLRIEKERAEFFRKEVASMEEENKKFDEMRIEYLKALEELESSRLKNNVLRKREKKLLKKLKESLGLIVKHNLKIESQEAHMLSKEVGLKRKDIVIKGLEHEVEEMRVVIDRLHEQKNEVSSKLETIENEVASKADSERILMENYNRIVNELENVKKDRASELTELIYLRWCHACLRHELARRKELEQQTKHAEEKDNTHEPGSVLSQNVAPEGSESDNESVVLHDNVAPNECKGYDSDNESVVHRHGPFFGPGRQHTKRRWLVRKFKKWVEGNEKHHEPKCFGSHSCVDEAKK